MTIALKRLQPSTGGGLGKTALVLGYALTTVLLGVSGLLFIPAVVQAAGAVIWASVAIGQAFGVILAVIVGYGWALTGPAMIAGSDINQQVLEFRKSVIARCLIGIPAVTIGTAVLWWIFPGNELITGLALLGTSLTGLSSNWLFVGLGRPFALLWCESVPRTVATFAAIVALSQGWSLEKGLAIQLMGIVVALVITLVVTTRWAKRFEPDVVTKAPVTLSSVVESLRVQTHGMASSLVSVLFLSAPVLVVGLIAPWALPAFALADKIQKQFISGIAPIVSVAQGWVPKGKTRTGIIIRSRKALAFGGFLGTFAATCLFLLGPWLWEFLGAGEIKFDLGLIAVLSAVCCLIFFERICSRAGLIPVGGGGQLVAATSIGSLGGVTLVLLLVPLGATAALIGVGAGFAITVALEVYFWGRRARSQRRRRRNRI